MFTQSGAFQEWAFRSGMKTVGVQPRSQLAVNSGDVAIAAAVAGHGVTRALSYQVADEVKAGRLRIVLEDFESEPLPVHLVHPDGRRAAARVRSFLDFAAERLRGAEALRG
jgi:DNA-binding transcriptional LysR family regulator